MPSVLYRFRPWSVLKPGGIERKSLSEIEGKYAYFSSPLTLNDPQDCALGPKLTGGRGDMDRIFSHGLADVTRLAGEKGCSVVGLNPNDPEVQAADALYQRREARKNTCVCCFSWDWSNPLMWAFYAQEHQGFCLGYSTKGELLRRAQPVLYTYSPVEVLGLRDAATGNDVLSFCKSTEWQFEKEWRVCLPELGPKPVALAGEQLVSVHVGYRMKDPQLQELVEALRKAGHKPETTKLFSMERLNMSFVLCQRAIVW